MPRSSHDGLGGEGGDLLSYPAAHPEPSSDQVCKPTPRLLYIGSTPDTNMFVTLAGGTTHSGDLAQVKFLTQQAVDQTIKPALQSLSKKPLYNLHNSIIHGVRVW